MWFSPVCLLAFAPPPQVGSIPPLRNFDPLGLSARFPNEVPRWREAELTHGRVGMLAASGFLVQERFHPLFPDVEGPALRHMTFMPAEVWGAIALGAAIVEGKRIRKGWANPFETPSNFQKLKSSYDPGDLGFDPLRLLPSDPTAELRMRNVELSHGRLAMLAAAGFLAQEAATGQPWIP